MLCPTCRLPVLQAITPVRRRVVILDPQPVDGGNVVLTNTIDGVHPTAITLGQITAGVVPVRRYQLHECPDHELVLVGHTDFCVARAVRCAYADNRDLAPEQIRRAAAEWLRPDDVSWCVCNQPAAADDIGHAVCAPAKQQQVSEDTTNHVDHIRLDPAGEPPYPDDGTLWACVHGHLYLITIGAQR